MTSLLCLAILLSNLILPFAVISTDRSHRLVTLEFSSSIADKMHLVYVYGTLKREEPNYGVLTDEKNGFAEYIGAAKTVTLYPLVIASRFNIPFLLDAPGIGHQVVGDVFRVDDNMLEVLDELESHPQLYEREIIPVEWLQSKPDEETINCWAYLLKKYKPFMLNLPTLQNYSSSGSHNLPYVPSEDLSDTDDI